MENFLKALEDFLSNSSPKFRLGVDFVFPRHNNNNKNNNNDPHLNFNEGNVLEAWNFVGKLNSQK